MSDRPCTCHPDDNPPVPCPQKFALSECRSAHNADAECERARELSDELLIMADDVDSEASGLTSEFSGPERVRWNDQLGAEVDDAIYCASTARDMGARIPRAE